MSTGNRRPAQVSGVRLQKRVDTRVQTTSATAR